MRIDKPEVKKEINFTAVSSSEISNNSIFLDSSDDKFKIKNNTGVINELGKSTLDTDFFFDDTNTTWALLDTDSAPELTYPESSSTGNLSVSHGNWSGVATYALNSNGVSNYRENVTMSIYSKIKGFRLYTASSSYARDSGDGNCNIDSTFTYNKNFSELQIKTAFYTGSSNVATRTKRIRIYIYNSTNNNMIGNYIEIYNDTSASSHTNSRQDWKIYNDSGTWKIDYIDKTGTNQTGIFGTDAATIIYMKINLYTYTLNNYSGGDTESAYTGLDFIDNDNFIE